MSCIGRFLFQWMNFGGFLRDSFGNITDKSLDNAEVLEIHARQF